MCTRCVRGGLGDVARCASFLIVNLVLVSGLAPTAAGQPTAFFSATGTFSAPTGQFTDFNFSFPLTSSLTLRTQASAGGTNSAGQTIAPGGIDSVLTFFSGGGTQIAQND